MSRNTLSFALPESIDVRVSTGHYGNTSKYIRDLIRKDQAEEARTRLRKCIEEGLTSGSGRPRTQDDEDELLAIANSEID
jgi:antitoxin ParD1/3/4